MPKPQKKQSYKNYGNGFDKSVHGDFYKRLLYIALCAIPLWVLANEKPPLSYVALAFFLCGGYNVIILIYSSRYIVDSFFPPVTLVETEAKPFDRFFYYFSSVFFFISLVCLLFELRILDSTFNGSGLFWKAGFLGIPIAILITIILKATNPSVYFESKRRYMVHFCLFVGCFFWAAAGGSFINHFYAKNEISPKEFTLIKKSIGGGRHNSHFIFLDTKPSEERFEVKESFYETLNEGETLLLDCKKGRLGYDVVVAFRKK